VADFVPFFEPVPASEFPVGQLFVLAPCLTLFFALDSLNQIVEPAFVVLKKAFLPYGKVFESALCYLQTSSLFLNLIVLQSFAEQKRDFEFLLFFD
jgi:hypothetical protein